MDGGTVSDEEAEFLGQLLQSNVLNHDIEQLPENLVALVEQYRRLENDIPVPTRAPGVYEADPVDAPFLNRGDHQSEERQYPGSFWKFLRTNLTTKTVGAWSWHRILSVTTIPDTTCGGQPHVELCVWSWPGDHD